MMVIVRREITDLKSTEEEEEEEREKKGKPKRPTLLNIDEKNRNAAKMFMMTNENPETGVSSFSSRIFYVAFHSASTAWENSSG